MQVMTRLRKVVVREAESAAAMMEMVSSGESRCFRASSLQRLTKDILPGIGVWGRLGCKHCMRFTLGTG